MAWYLKLNTKNPNMDQISKLREEYIGKTSCDLRLGKGFLAMTSKAKSIKEEIEKVNIWNLKFYSVKNTVNEKTNYTQRYTVFEIQMSDKRLT